MATFAHPAPDARLAAILPIRYSGSGSAMRFTVGNPLDPGNRQLAQDGKTDARPPAFDATGRMWWPMKHAPLHQAARLQLPHWIAAIDVEQLFAAPPTVLRRDVDGEAAVEAERAVTAETAPAAAAPGDVTRVVTPPIFTRECTDDGDTPVVEWPFDLIECRSKDHGTGFELTGPSDGFHAAAEYDVWAPVQGDYAVAYRVSAPAGGRIRLLVDGAATDPVDVGTAGAWRSWPGGTVTLSPGRHRLRLVAPQGQGGWTLDRFTLTRVR
jgi:hypothetical protein